MYEYIDDYFEEFSSFLSRESSIREKLRNRKFDFNRYNIKKNNNVHPESFKNPLEYLISKYQFNEKCLNFKNYSDLMFNSSRKLWMFAEIETTPFHFGWDEKTDEVVLIFEEDNSIYQYVAPTLKCFFEISAYLLSFFSYEEAIYRENKDLPQTDYSNYFTQLVSNFELDEKYFEYWKTELCIND